MQRCRFSRCSSITAMAGQTRLGEQWPRENGCSHTALALIAPRASVLSHDTRQADRCKSKTRKRERALPAPLPGPWLRAPLPLPLLAVSMCSGGVMTPQRFSISSEVLLMPGQRREGGVCGTTIKSPSQLTNLGRPSSWRTTSSPPLPAGGRAGRDRAAWHALSPPLAARRLERSVPHHDGAEQDDGSSARAEQRHPQRLCQEGLPGRRPRFLRQRRLLGGW